MQILPAIDLKDRKVVRLYKGDFDTVHQVARDPVETARAFLRAGTRWVHICLLYTSYEVPNERLEQAYQSCPPELISALEHAADNIRDYNQRLLTKTVAVSYTHLHPTIRLAMVLLLPWTRP